MAILSNHYDKDLDRISSKHTRDLSYHKYHLLRPSSTASKYADDNNLQTYSNWIYVHLPDNYIYGPLDFTKVNNRKCKDKIPRRA